MEVSNARVKSEETPNMLSVSSLSVLYFKICDGKNILQHTAWDLGWCCGWWMSWWTGGVACGLLVYLLVLIPFVVCFRHVPCFHVMAISKTNERWILFPVASSDGSAGGRRHGVRRNGRADGMGVEWMLII